MVKYQNPSIYVYIFTMIRNKVQYLWCTCDAVPCICTMTMCQFIPCGVLFFVTLSHVISFSVYFCVFQFLLFVAEVTPIRSFTFDLLRIMVGITCNCDTLSLPCFVYCISLLSGGLCYAWTFNHLIVLAINVLFYPPPYIYYPLHEGKPETDFSKRIYYNILFSHHSFQPFVC